MERSNAQQMGREAAEKLIAKQPEVAKLLTMSYCAGIVDGEGSILF